MALVAGILLLAAAIIVGGVYGWRRFVKHSTAKPAASITARAAKTSTNISASPLPASSSTSLPAANPSGALESPFDLSVSASTFTQVDVHGGGNLVLDTSIYPRKNRHFLAKAGFAVPAAGSSEVLLELNGEAMPPAGAPGTSGTITLTS